jgi:hypothetical protein
MQREQLQQHSMHNDDMCTVEACPPLLHASHIQLKLLASKQK